MQMMMFTSYLLPALLLGLQVAAVRSTIVAEWGGQATISCNYTKADDEQVLAVMWKHGEANVVTSASGAAFLSPEYSDRSFFDAENWTLTLDQLDFSDEGSYTCTVISNKGSVSSSDELTILASPTIGTTVFPVLDDGKGEKTLAECKVTAASKPFTVSWVVNDKDEVIPDTFRTEAPNPIHDSLFDATLDLTIHPDADRNDGRTFNCVVTDALGQVKVSRAAMNVFVPTTTPATTTVRAMPTIVSFPSKRTVMTVGDSKEFTCSATGVPLPYVTWSYEGEESVEDLKPELGETSMTLIARSIKDAGRYVCKASNDKGEDKRAFELLVQIPPMINGDEEFANETEKLIASDEEVELMCAAEGSPVPDIAWSVADKNSTDTFTGKQVTDGYKTTSTLNLTSEHIAKRPVVVTCTATNALGTASKTFRLRYPAMNKAYVGTVVGVVLAVFLALVIIFLIIFFTLTRRQAKKASITEPEKAEKGCSSGCFATPLCRAHKTKEDNSAGDELGEIKEIKEEGTAEEKQKLTEAEEKPAEEKEGTKEAEKEEESKEQTPEEKKSKRKTKVTFPGQCCRGNKQELKEENDSEAEGKKAGSEGEDGPQSKEDKDDEKAKDQDRDSGKGDTLMKTAPETNN